MAGYTLQTLSAYRGQISPVVQPVEWPLWNDEASRDERFIGYLNHLLSFSQPTHPSETEMMARFTQIGIGPGVPFDAETLNGDIRDAIQKGVSGARESMTANIRDSGQKVNGWMSSDVFGTREWYDGDFLLRAVAAMAGWGGNDVIEAAYPTTREDASGESLDGAQRYQMTFSSAPPAKAFWSITMYDTSYDGTAGYLVENPINRYLINSTTEGLIYGEDGSLTIYVQHEQPEGEKAANWLPAPAEPFYLAMRIYRPEESVMNGEWEPPAVQKVS